MKRRNLAMIGVALPSTNALALANFQQISSGLVPLPCQLTYDSQIPVCTVSDFQDGCSQKCQTALSILAVQVTTSCIGVGASANTLLGIVMRGGIISALCPTADTVSTTSSSTRGNGLTTIRPSIVTSATKPPSSVTVPTSSSVIASTTESRTTSTSSATTSTTSQSQRSSSQSTSSTSSVTQTSTTSISSVTPPASSTTADDDGAGGAQSTTLVTATESRGPQVIATSTNPADAATTSKSSSGNGSGGGSPFDIQSAATHFGINSALCALVVVAWTALS